MKLTTNIHTIFLLVGPTESGKTTFAKQILLPQLQDFDAETGYRSNVQYISSDDIRQNLLGYDYHKHDSIMLESSGQAFHILFEQLKAVTSFPINADFVVLDTIGLSEDFREKVLQISKEHRYNVEAIVFDYKQREDYYSSDCSKRIITNHLTRLKREVLKQLSRSTYKRIHKVREKDFYDVDRQSPNPNYIVEIADQAIYKEHFLPKKYQYIVIGDVHEKVDELKELLRKHGFSIEGNIMEATEITKNQRVVLIGDWIDKGANTSGIIEFLYTNQKWFYFVKGNHENFVSNYLLGNIDKKQVDSDLLRNFFDSIPVLIADAELNDKFQELVSLSKDFYRFVGGNTSSFYLTHAPCSTKYIGKLDGTSRKKQRKFALDRTKPVQEQLQFVEKEAIGNHPYHLFGHVALKEVWKTKNKMAIDTGCVHGNQLSSVTLNAGRPYFKSQKSLGNGRFTEEALPSLIKRKKAEVNMGELDESDRKRLAYTLQHKVNFISGTMAPADKDVEHNELESLRQGLRYFKKQGVHKVVLQPKYMGSRCNLYLSQELAGCYAISRNGYKIKDLELTSVFEELLKKFSPFMKENKIKRLILDGELLPWSALGSGLIQRQFRSIDVALEKELAYLQKHGFSQQLQYLKDRYEATTYKKDQQQMSKKQLIEKYGNATYQVFKQVTVAGKKVVPLEEHLRAHEVFHEQIERYGQEEALKYKPFTLLKIIYENGEEEIPSQSTSELFSFVSTDEYVVIDFSESDYIERAEDYFQQVTTEKRMEGVVLKPEVLKSGVAPYMKVRNEEYLSIVYGYDYRFPAKYAKLIKQKNTKTKLRASIKEYELGQEMLSYSSKDMKQKAEAYQQIVSNILFEVKQEKGIDPRL
ncbi:metallophosphoesterase [Bacillus sp. 2205SS5-2]|uniref:metallophosphoesterase n=1 Tax=Bacillus sp. 2205SS5-2 TaxID=3109031 RepID=UPI00300632AB